MTILFWLVAIVIIVFNFVVFRGAPYVPSHKKQVKGAFKELYALGSKDVLVDVGSGDGIILREAVRHGATAIGYELNPVLVFISRFLSRNNKKVTVYLADFWFVHLPAETTVVYAFAVTRDINKMATKLQNEATRLNKPLYFISYGNAIPGRPPVKVVRAHTLYRFEPLHGTQAQV